MKSNALIYSPSLDGHRQIYIFVMAHVLKELGFNVYVAGNTNQAFDHLFYIENLKENSQITLLDTSKYEKGGVDITLKEFKELQNSIKTALTIFAEADNHIRLLVSQVFDKKK